MLTQAVIRAAAILEIRGAALAGILGLSEATLSRMRNGDAALERGTKHFEIAVLFVRLYRSLDAIAGGDEAVARAWLRNINTQFEQRPIDAIQQLTGLVDVIAYLDARRALV